MIFIILGIEMILLFLIFFISFCIISIYNKYESLKEKCLIFFKIFLIVNISAILFCGGIFLIYLGSQQIVNLNR